MVDPLSEEEIRRLFQARREWREGVEAAQEVEGEEGRPGPRAGKVLASLVSGVEPAQGILRSGRRGFRPVLSAAGLLIAAAAAWGWVSWRSVEPGIQKHRNDVKVDGQTDARWNWRGGGERIRLEEGMLVLEAASGASGFAVETPAGEVRVLGTRFSVRVLYVPAFEEGGRPEPAAVVELTEGRLALVAGGEEKRLSPMQRGVLVRGTAPRLMESRPVMAQEIRGAWDSLVRSFRDRDRQQAIFFAAVLASYGEEGVISAPRPQETGEAAEEWIRRVLEVLEK